MAPVLVISNATVYPIDPPGAVAEAVAVAGDRILAVGDAPSVWARAADRAGGRHRVEVMDLAGGILLPGFCDSHVHFAAYSLLQDRLDLDGVPSLAEAVNRVAEAARRLPAGGQGGSRPWVLGRGWNKNEWPEGRFPGRHDLDPVTGAVPVALNSKDGHSLWVNSRALELAGVAAGTPDPKGGVIDRDPVTGEPTGILKETAMDLVSRVIPPPTAEQLTAAVRRAVGQAHRHGLTGVHDMEGADAFRAFQALRRRGELHLRVLMQLPVDHLDEAVAIGLQTGFGDPLLRVGSIKLFADGALGVQTAHMLEPYEGAPQNVGVAIYTPDELRELVGRAVAGGFSVACHAIGDRANREVLDAIEAHAAESRARGLRHRIEHAQCLHPDDIGRFARLGVIASMQPIHATSDRYTADRHWGARSRYAYAFRTLLASGARLAFGSDAPVEPIDPLAGLYAAVTRRRATEPDVAPWYPEERISLEEAVAGYTLGAAFAAGEEAASGSIAPGKLADLVALDRDVFREPPEAILTARVAMTMVAGRVVHHAG